MIRHRLLWPFFSILPIVVSAVTPARAAELYHLNQSNSSVRFSVGTLGFFRARGHFARFDATVLIDPAHPTNTKVSVTIPASSVVTPWAQESTMIRSPAFFDVAHHGKIRFTSGTVMATAPGRYSVHGQLTLRDVTRPVTLSAHLVKTVTDPTTGDTVDDFTITGIVSRKAFGITADPLFIDNRVHIVIHARILVLASGHA